MNKEDFISALSDKTDFSKADCKKFLDANFEVIQESLVSGETIQFIGFGNYSVSEIAARTGRNPSTWEAIKIAASKRVKFAPGKQLKDAVNSGKKKKK